MPTSEQLCTMQEQWEGPRGVDKFNVDYNIPRTQVELNEAREETDPLLKLLEIIDVVIVLHGGMYKLANELGIPFCELDKMILSKMMTNHTKYQLDYFGCRETGEAMEVARYYWELGVNPEDFEANEYGHWLP